MLEEMRGEINTKKSICESLTDDNYFYSDSFINKMNNYQNGHKIPKLNDLSWIIQPIVWNKVEDEYDPHSPIKPVDKADIDLNNLNKIDEHDGHTILHKAVLQNDNSLVNFLWNQDDIDLNVLDKHGNSALFYACQHGNKQIAQTLKFEGATLVAFESTLAKALTDKAKIGDLDSIKLFHKWGANLTVLSEENTNLAHAAAEAQQYDTLIYLAKSCDKSLFNIDSSSKSVFDLINDPNMQQTIRQLAKSQDLK